ncbi:Myb-like_DNA-binding domain-containing protein [Hexamita inflata]|uniref:Myb-like DNA-binding domain-containing protein n=1 Tax=Hexamita inflata TaxID=28002 RepID=A0AA86U7J1_9EUKA|nr:Myb-like DNA-binding domain-containing protein [Hexamita inflata]CAI9963519.1 Myb-like DNA-binding domain-containing protein [Hexamita inflata]
MTTQEHKQYRKWSDEEILKIFYLSKQCKAKVINWDKVSSHLEGRTAQQCKSFYNNRIREYELENLIKQTNIHELGVKGVEYLLLSTNKQEDPVRQIFFDNLTTEIIMNIQMALTGNQMFRYDNNILKLVREIISVYNQNKIKMKNQINQQGFAKYETHTVSKDQFEQLIKMMDNFDCDNLFLKISCIISQSIE